MTGTPIHDRLALEAETAHLFDLTLTDVLEFDDRGWAEAKAQADAETAHFIDVVIPEHLRATAELLNNAGVLPEGLRVTWS